MKVLFINPTSTEFYPIQIGTISSFLKKAGHQIKLLTLIIKGSISDNHIRMIDEAMYRFKPEFVAFSCYETSFFWVKTISEIIKRKWSKTKTIVGGYYPTLAPQKVIECQSIDIICRGEGERAFLELLGNPENYRIKNLWFRQKKKIIKNTIRSLLSDLDLLPFADREIVDYQSILDLEMKGEKNVKMIVSRGCPFVCTYCSNEYLRNIYPNRQYYVRLRSPESVISELKLLKQKYSFDKVGFADENLTANEKWLKKFCDLYKREINIPFYCPTRPESCSIELLKILKESGCYLLLIGVESGDEEYRKNVLKRSMTNQQIINAFLNARKCGLKTWSFTMVGFPYESRKMVLKTLLLNWKCHPDFVMASIYYPFSGTQLGDLCYKNNLVDLDKKNNVTSYAWDSILVHQKLYNIEIKSAKYLNSLTAVRSLFFWQKVIDRLSSFLVRGERI